MLFLQHDNVKVEVVATDASLTFYDSAAIVKAGSRIWTNRDEWRVRLLNQPQNA